MKTHTKLGPFIGQLFGRCGRDGNSQSVHCQPDGDKNYFNCRHKSSGGHVFLFLRLYHTCRDMITGPVLEYPTGFFRKI